VTSGVDQINKRAWARKDVVELLSTSRTWSEDAGEAAVLLAIAEEVDGGAILDVGIGSGRTVPALRAISENYVGIDYTPELVAVAVERFPGVDIRVGDARDLSPFDDDSFALVFFSANGIDAVPHDDRQLVLREARRVLVPGGVFAFSTHNVDHRNAGRAPWDPRQVWPRDMRRVARRLVRLPRGIRAYRRNRQYASRGNGWAMLNTPLYDFGLVIHYVSLSTAIEELTAAGFSEAVEAYDMFGQRLDVGAPAHGTKWFHLIARVPGGSRVKGGGS
jgi:SAM-dependent methyltransferase